MATPFTAATELRTKLEIAAGTSDFFKKIRFKDDSISDLLTAACRYLGYQDRKSQSHGGDAPAFQASSQRLAAFLQPPLQRAERPTELLGRFIASQTGQVAQQKRRTQSFRQPLQFLVERLPYFPPNQFVHRFDIAQGSGNGSFAPRNSILADLRWRSGRLTCAAKQETACASADRFRQTGETEKYGLENVLGIVSVRDQSTGGLPAPGDRGGQSAIQRPRDRCPRRTAATARRLPTARPHRTVGEGTAATVPPIERTLNADFRRA